jgi:GTP-binding protein
VPLLPISAVANVGLDQLKYTLFETVTANRSGDAVDA